MIWISRPSCVNASDCLGVWLKQHGCCFNHTRKIKGTGLLSGLKKAPRRWGRLNTSLARLLQRSEMCLLLSRGNSYLKHPKLVAFFKKSIRKTPLQTSTNCARIGSPSTERGNKCSTTIYGGMSCKYSIAATNAGDPSNRRGTTRQLVSEPPKEFRRYALSVLPI